MTAGMRRVQIERWTWDAAAGAFVATGDVTEAADEERIASGKSRQAGRFLRGPVPWEWVIAAARLPGQALIVGLCLWRLAGATQSPTVTLGNAELEPFGIDRAMKCRALAALEEAGLIIVAREAGRFPRVTLPTPVRSKKAAHCWRVIEFLMSCRVELNAFTSNALLQWIQAKLQKHGVRKVIPDERVLAEEYRRQHQSGYLRKHFGELLERSRKHIADLDLSATWKRRWRASCRRNRRWRGTMPLWRLRRDRVEMNVDYASSPYATEG